MVMKARWPLLGLALVLAGCPLGWEFPAPVEYTSKGVCSGVELTTPNPEVRRIVAYYDYPPGNTGVDVTPNQPVRIPDPNRPLHPDEPRVTRYYIAFHEPTITTVDLDLTWRCLPDKEPVRVKYTYGSGNDRILLITENPESPHGFDIQVMDHSAYRPRWR